MQNNKTEYEIDILLEKIEDFSKEFSDFTINCRDGKEVKTAKIILAARSELFADLFKMSPETKYVDLPDLEYSTMAFIVDSLIQIDLR